MRTLTMHNKNLIKTVALLCGLLFIFVTADSFAANRASCAQKAQETIQNLDKWINEYSGQMESAEPVQKGKYEEWIRELKKLKTLVSKAKDKLGSGDNSCSSDDCIKDQCDMVDVAEQQVTQLIEETEEQLGKESAISGETAGREVNLDDKQIGNEEMLDMPDRNDATQHSYANDSSTSDVQSEGRTGDVFENSGNPEQRESVEDVPEDDPLEEISAQ